MHKTISYVIYTILTGLSDMFQYWSPVNLILFCVKTYYILQINCFYHLYLEHITGIYYYPSQKIGQYLPVTLIQSVFSKPMIVYQDHS